MTIALHHSNPVHDIIVGDEWIITMDTSDGLPGWIVPTRLPADPEGRVMTLLALIGGMVVRFFGASLTDGWVYTHLDDAGTSLADVLDRLVLRGLVARYSLDEFDYEVELTEAGLAWCERVSRFDPCPVGALSLVGTRG